MQCNFANSCTGVELYGYILRGDCINEDGHPHATSINLNYYIGNDNGRLEYPGESFGSSCVKTALNDGHTLTASCKGADGQYHDSSMDLNYVVGNSYGYMEPCRASNADHVLKSSSELEHHHHHH
uniref:Cyanovirin-N homolog n=1 Tax=Ceratopteris richardii TaxID=49495 RepID=D0VWW7_CERRI|nr:Chain A, Cyanovirin-N homolog [Ceratopteris richardii]